MTHKQKDRRTSVPFSQAFAAIRLFSVFRYFQAKALSQELPLREEAYVEQNNRSCVTLLHQGKKEKNIWIAHVS